MGLGPSEEETERAYFLPPLHSLSPPSALPCGDTSRRQLSTRQEVGPHQTLDLTGF